MDGCFYAIVAAALLLLGCVISLGLALVAYIPIHFAGIREPLLRRWTRHKWRWFGTSLIVCLVCFAVAFAADAQGMGGNISPVFAVRIAMHASILWAFIWSAYSVFTCISISIAMIGVAGKKWFPQISDRLGLHEHPLLKEDDS